MEEQIKSGLLMSVIKNLTASKDDVERDAIKNQLEERLKASDGKLNTLVITHHKDLTMVMQAFSKITSNLRSSKERLSQAKKHLQDCQNLLLCRLEDLKRLNEESQTNEKVLQLLNEVDELLKVPNRVNDHISKKDYLEATKLLVEKQKYIDDNFSEVDCLKEVRTELETKREEIYKWLMEELKSNDPSTDRSLIFESLGLLNKTPEIPEFANDVSETQPARAPLFRFSQSSHAMCFNEHFKEQNEAMRTLLTEPAFTKT